MNSIWEARAIAAIDLPEIAAARPILQLITRRRRLYLIGQARSPKVTLALAANCAKSLFGDIERVQLCDDECFRPLPCLIGVASKSKEPIEDGLICFDVNRLHLGPLD